MSFTKELINWYKKSSRDLPWRNTTDPYLIWLSEIILQQTRVEQGLPYFLKFKTLFPSLEDLANATEEEVLKAWQGLGYYSRARNLHSAAKFIYFELNNKFPDNYDKLLNIKGIGPYTAAAVASFAYGEAVAVVDGNVERVLSRYFGITEEIKSASAQKQIRHAAQELIDHEDPATFNQAIMELGSLICKPKQAQCSLCPVQQNCFAFEQNRVYDFPKKNKKTKVKEVTHNYLVFEFEDQILIEQRKEGIWKNMYQFPLLEGKITMEQLMEEAASYTPLSSKVSMDLSYSCEHILSHRKINAHFYRIQVNQPLKPLKTHIFEIELDDLEHKYPVSVLIDKFLKNREHGK